MSPYNCDCSGTTGAITANSRQQRTLRRGALLAQTQVLAICDSSFRSRPIGAVARACSSRTAAARSPTPVCTTTPNGRPSESPRWVRRPIAVAAQWVAELVVERSRRPLFPLVGRRRGTGEAATVEPVDHSAVTNST